MAIIITPTNQFKHLNGDPTYSIKPGGIGREREIIADVEITGGTTYSTNGILVDFSSIARFREVYLCNVVQGHNGMLPEFVPGADDDAALGKIKLYGRNSGTVPESFATGTVTAATVLENTFSSADIVCSTVLENTFADGTVTHATAVVGNTVTVNGLLYTAVSGSPAEDEWDIDTGNDQSAASLATQITADTRVGFLGDLSATSASEVTTIETDVLGVGGNAITLASNNGTTLAVSASELTGGVDADTVTVNGLVYTAVAGARQDDTEFSTDTGDTETGVDLAAAINADVRAGTLGDISAGETTGTVTVTTDVEGVAGDAITLVSSDGGTLAVTGSGNLVNGHDADTFTVNGLVYTAVAGARGDDTEFSTDTSNDATAIDLAAAITADGRTGITVDSINQTAVAVNEIVTITSDAADELANTIDLSSTDGTTLAVSGAFLTGGIGGDISGFAELEDGDATIVGRTFRCIVRGI
jgi:hypothetical protein